MSYYDSEVRHVNPNTNYVICCFAVDSDSDFDLDSVTKTDNLSNNAARHKNAVRPRKNRTSRRMTKFSSCAPTVMVSALAFKSHVDDLASKGYIRIRKSLT